MPVPCQENERSCIMCVRDIDFVSFSTIFWLDFWTVTIVGYFFLSIVLLALNKEYYLYTVKPVLRGHLWNKEKVAL